MMNKKQKLNFYILYSALFFVFALAILYFYYSIGNTMIDADGDGFRQHYRALLYYSTYLKNVFHNLLNGHFVVPGWDLLIGEGSDILNSLHYYCIGDIFTFFCFLVPEKYMYLYYDAATIMRLYFAGIAFCELCFYLKKNNKYVVLAGALLYVFNPFAISNMSSHVFFLSAMVYFPLIILGVEKIINGDKPYLLSIAVMFSSLSNIYFFFMNVISTVVYTVVRLLFIDRNIKDKINSLFKVAIFSFVGLCMSAIVLLPMLHVMSSNARLESRVSIDLFYPFNNYKSMFTGFVFGAYMFYGGFTVLGLLSLFNLYSSKNKNVLKILFIIGTIFASIPFFGSLYNAMVSPTARWLYAVSLLVSYIIVDTFSEPRNLNKNYLVNIVVTLIYFITCFVIDRERWQIHIMFMFMSLAIILYLRFIKNEKYDHKLVLLTSVFIVAFTIFYYFSPRYWYFADHGKSISSLENIKYDEHSIFEKIDDDSFFRYSGNQLTSNESIQGKHSSTQYYWSIVNDYIVNFRKQLGLCDRSNHHIDNYDDRYNLNMLSGVKYYIHNERGVVPYSYEYLNNINNFEVFKTDSNLSLVYGYDAYVDNNEWDKLSLVEKNEILTQAAYIDSELDFKKANPVFDNKIIDYKMVCDDGLSIDNHKIIVKKVDTAATITSDSDIDGEYYLVVEGLYSNLLSNIEITYGDIRKVLFFKGNDNPHFTDRHDYMINLGYMNGMDKELVLKFHDIGEFDYDNISVVCQPLDKQEEYVKNLNSIQVDNLVIDDKVNLDVNLKDDKILCFSLPYSKGWKAKIDGKSVDVFNCNIQYIGVFVGKGTHHIELTYSSPMLRVGLVISIISSLCLFAYWFKNRNYNKIR